MTFSSIVEVSSVFPGSFGGCVFWGVVEGNKRSNPFKVKYSVGIRLPSVGEKWEIRGYVQPYDQYNKQVIVQEANFQGMPHDDYVVKFLGVHPKFRGFGFGIKNAEKLAEDIGITELVKLLNDGNWKAIADARISEGKAQRICEEWHDIKEDADLAAFLSEYKLDANMANQIKRLCKFDTVERLKRNPFALIALSNSSIKTFKTIAKVAQAQNIKSDDYRTLIGCVEFALYKELKNSHTTTEIPRAIKSINAYLDIVNSEISPEDAIKVALAAKAICVLDDGRTIYLQPISAAYIEQSVETALSLLHKTPLLGDLFFQFNTLKEHIYKYSNDHNIKFGWGFTEKQIEAVEMALTKRVSLLSGYGGTGKTAVLKAIYELALEMGTSVHVAALAGKAANRAKQAIGAADGNISTVHTMIKLIEQKSKFGVDISSDPLLIIDECSMLDISLMCRLIKLFGKHPFRLLLVGDGAQLPPIGFGLFWHKLIESEAPHIQLTEVHRMVADSALHKCAMHIRNGQRHDLPVYRGQSEGVYLMANISDFTSAIVRLRKSLNELMVLTSYSSDKYKSSTKTLNRNVQAMVNPQKNGSLSMRYGSITLHEGDPVLATKNTHKLGIFNGMTGSIDSINFDDDAGKIICSVKFDDDPNLVKLTQENCWEVGLQLAYLITIHKSQGSEYNNCAIILDSPYLEKSALYTALTRTRKLCILIGTNEQYNAAIQRQSSYELVRSGFEPKF